MLWKVCFGTKKRTIGLQCPEGLLSTQTGRSRLLNGAMEIRPITESDAESFQQALGAVAAERKFLLTLKAPPLESIKAFIHNNVSKGYPQFVAESESRVIGWADFVPVEKESLLHTAHLGMGVLKEFRGKGVGSALLSSVTEAAIHAGFTRLELEVFANNVAAVTLYEKHGFEHEGTKRQARIIDGKYIDALIMSRIL